MDDFNDINQIKKNWIPSQSLINLDGKVKFFKTHQINCKIGFDNFTNLDNTIGVIHILRDPRNVITSIKNHYNYNSYNEAKEFMFDENTWIGKLLDKNTENIENKIPTLIASWKTHYNSWKNTKKNYLLIKYENLIENPKIEFDKIKNYIEKLLKININAEKMKKAIESSSFKNLQSQEKLGKFGENVKGKTGEKKNFFYLGKENKWKKLLNDNISNEICEKFSPEMKELGYL